MRGKAIYRLADGVATITLSSPAARNAIDPFMARDLHRCILQAAEEARVLVLTGEGSSFCAGANIANVESDLAEIAQSGGKIGAQDVMVEFYDPVVCSLRDLQIPFVTAVNGPAAGFGASLALMGDLIFAVEGAYFLQAFRNVGLIPDGGGTYLLPRMLSRPRAMELVLLGQRLEARKALNWGLINDVFAADKFNDGCEEVIGALATGPRSLGLMRRAVWESFDNSWSEQLGVEARIQSEAVATSDYQEGIAAFRNKRVPAFEGR